MKIEKKIVDILDRFTKLTSELSLRQKQYTFYRDKLLTFDRHVKWQRLGEVAKIKHGKDWKNLKKGNIPVYGSGGIINYVDTYSYNQPTVLIPRKGTITNIFYVDIPFWNVDTIYYTVINDKKIKPKFFYYFMKKVDLISLDTGSSRPSLTQKILNSIKIPILPLAEQNRIVGILDKFDALANSITQGLPKEIKLRKQQYQYYLNALLDFPKPTKD